MISVDTKKKELVGAYKNAGQEWLPSGEPVKVKVHDFIDKELGRANPYGVYDTSASRSGSKVTSLVSIFLRPAPAWRVPVGSDVAAVRSLDNIALIS